MAEKRLNGDGSPASQPGDSHERLFANRREWAAALILPWCLVVVLLASYAGERVDAHVPLARVLCATVVVAALACGAMCADARGVAGAMPVARVARLALVVALLGVPVVAGVMTATELGFSVVPAAAVMLYAVAFALLCMSHALGDAYAVAVAGWFAAPPFVYYLFLEMYTVRWPALLYVSPASGAVAAAGAGNVVAGCVYASIVPVCVVGVFVVGGGRRNRLRAAT